MAWIVRVPVENDGQDYVSFEVDYRDIDESGFELVADGRRVYQATTSLGESMTRLMPALGAILKRLRDQPYSPDQITVQLALKLGGEGNLIITKGSAEAAIAITMAWLRAGPPPASRSDPP